MGMIFDLLLFVFETFKVGKGEETVLKGRS